MKSLPQAYLDISLELPVEDIKVKQRLDRAYDIVRELGYGYTIVKDGDIYRVCKASTSAVDTTPTEYIASVHSCSCPDFASARGNLCKHRLAIMLMEAMEKGDSVT